MTEQDKQARDYPEVSETVWSTAITENSLRLNAEREARGGAPA